MTFDQVVQKLDDLSNQVQGVQSSTQFVIGTIIAILGLVLVGLPFAVKSVVNWRVNKELDTRLLKILEANPPIFSVSSDAVPDENKRIYLKGDIDGIDQLDPETVISVRAAPEKSTVQSIQDAGLVAFLNIDETSKKPYLYIVNYFPNNGKVFYSLLWPRSKFVKNREHNIRFFQKRV